MDDSGPCAKIYLLIIGYLILLALGISKWGYTPGGSENGEFLSAFLPFSADGGPGSSAVYNQIYSGFTSVPDGGMDIELPDTGIINRDNGSGTVFWWIHITDTQDVWTRWKSDEIDTGGIDKINRFFNITVRNIGPLYIINTGDLVDSDFYSFMTRNRGQRAVEWEYYNSTISKWTDYTRYFDIYGNHDVYRDPGYKYYLNYSISGSAFGSLQFTLHLNTGTGKYAFFFLPVTEDRGLEYPFALGGYLNKNELDRFTADLQNTKDYNLTFAFGHHPPFEIFSELSSEGRSFIGLLKEYGVDYYACGHGHENTYQQIGTTAAVETDKFAHGDYAYRIVSVDNDIISSAVFYGDGFPVGLITYPADIHFSLRDPQDLYGSYPDRIGALAFSDVNVTSVKWRADSGEWKDMYNEKGNLWAAPFDPELNDGKLHILEINITDSAGRWRISSIEYKYARSYFFGWDTGRWVIMIVFISVLALALYITFRHRRLRMETAAASVSAIEDSDVKTGRYGKKKIGGKEIPPTPDHKLAKWAAVKFVGYIILPLAFGLYYAEAPTVSFAFFAIGVDGFIYSDVLMLFSGIYLLFTYPFLLMFLSSRHKVGAGITLIFSMLITVFMIVFYILHFPQIGWIAPGYYFCLGCDFIMFKRLFAPDFGK